LGCWTSFAALWKSPNPAISRGSAYLFRKAGAGRPAPQGKSLISSVVVHVAAIFLLFQVADNDIAVRNSVNAARLKDEVIYYPLPLHHEPKPVPRIAPPGPGGKSGRGAQPKEDPKPGSTTFHRDLTVISNPIHPDNNHQTIIQPKSPPDLIIKQDLKLPNVVFGNPLAKPKAPLQFLANAVKPNERAQTKVDDAAAPQTSVTDPGIKFAAPAQPKAPLQFLANAVKPIEKAQTVDDVAAPQTSVTDPGIKLAALAPTVAQPHLPVPLALAHGAVRGGVPAPGSGTGMSAPSAGGSAGDFNPGEPNGLLILGTDPVAGGGSISLPPGNRYGSFSVSPAGGEPGSPGGVAGGGAGGTGGVGPGGDESTGTGGGRSGGGGGGLAIAGAPVSVSGAGGIQGARGYIDSLIAGGVIYPVITTTRVRKNALVVSASGVGGGGLGIYQALQCGRIYTIFVPMPTVSWTLQYCQQDDSQPKPNNTSISRVIQMDTGLLPPDPVEEFDFRRMPFPADQPNKIIVLKGTIREDGNVDNLKVYQGVLKEMDEFALAAFSKWKFNPAKRAGKTVAVQILVGIQLPSPAAH
jgi:hypothetical protein